MNKFEQSLQNNYFKQKSSAYFPLLASHLPSFVQHENNHNFLQLPFQTNFSPFNSTSIETQHTSKKQSKKTMAHAQVQCNNPSDSNFSLKDKHIGFPDLASSFPYILHASSKGFEPSTFNVGLNQEKIDKSVQTNLHGMIETFEQNATQYNKTQVKNFEQFTKQNIKNINFKPQTFTHSPKSSYQKSNFKHSFYNIN